MWPWYVWVIATNAMCWTWSHQRFHLRRSAGSQVPELPSPSSFWLLSRGALSASPSSSALPGFILRYSILIYCHRHGYTCHRPFRKPMHLRMNSRRGLRYQMTLGQLRSLDTSYAKGSWSRANLRSPVMWNFVNLTRFCSRPIGPCETKKFLWSLFVSPLLQVGQMRLAFASACSNNAA